MKVFRIIGTNIREAFAGVFRNFSLSIASISCIIITLILVGFSIILSVNVNEFTSNIEEDMTIVVFLDRNVSEEDIGYVEGKLELITNIKDIEFNSKNTVKESMQEESDVFESILSQYTDETNPLQDTYLVKVIDINEMTKTASEIKKIKHVDIVKYGEGAVEELIKIFDLVKKITYIAVIALIIITAFLISNTIKIAIQSRSREIEIRRLVGASNRYIKRPFFIEGVILGIIGSLIPVFACCYGYNYLYKKLGGKVFTDIITLVKPSMIIKELIVVLVALGVVVGAFGSLRAVRKYLKV